MYDENNYLSVSNNVFIENTSNNKNKSFENLLNPDIDVNINL
jgi:alanyl-tRNA synthetase